MTLGRSVHFVLAVCFWGLIFAMCLSWRLQKRRNSKKEALERRALIKRLLHPDWEFYERHLQRPAPAALRELFADRHLITSGGLNYEKGETLSSFNPVVEGSLVDADTSRVGHSMVPFVWSGCGDPIYLRPGATEADTVYIAYHDDPGNVQIFAKSVAVMVEKLKDLNAATRAVKQKL